MSHSYLSSPFNCRKRPFNELVRGRFAFVEHRLCDWLKIQNQFQFPHTSLVAQLDMIALPQHKACGGHWEPTIVFACAFNRNVFAVFFEIRFGF